MTADDAPPPATAAELRRDMRHWRRGHATTTWGAILMDAYIAVFTVLLGGAMAISVLRTVREEAWTPCVSTACTNGRGALPWVLGLALVAIALGLARLLGPGHATPAEATWLLRAPVGRSGFLWPRLGRLMAAVGLLGLVCGGAVATLLAGSLEEGLAYATGWAGWSVAVVGLAVVGQRGGGLRWWFWVLGATLWGCLAAIAFGVPLRAGPAFGLPVATLAGAAVPTLGVALVLAHRSLPDVPTRTLVPGGRLAPGLSGALAMLDLGLVYDMLLARRWNGVAWVRPRTGGPGGVGALLTRDIIRLVRTPGGPVVLAAVVVVPYAADVLDAGPVVPLIAVLSIFLGSLPLFSALRVASRTPGLTRTLPFSRPAMLLALCLVPGACTLLAGVATIGALRSVTADAGAAVALGAAVGVIAVAATVRWICGRPPDFSRPLVATPAGAVPTNLYGSALRGFDVALICGGILALWPTPNGAVVAASIALVVISVVLSRRD